MKRVLKWFGIGVLSIVILFLALYGMPDLVVTEVDPVVRTVIGSS